jgi:voltage-gated sodium channel
MPVLVTRFKEDEIETGEDPGNSISKEAAVASSVASPDVESLNSSAREGTKETTETELERRARPSFWGSSSSPAENVGRASSNRKSVMDRRSLFPDVEEAKRNVRDQLLKPPYNVSDYYHQGGTFRKIATNPIFENMTLAVISFNALWISIDTDHNKSVSLLEAGAIFQIAEHVFCVYFTFEWFVRFMSFAKKRDGLKDAWFTFDSALVFMMVMETWCVTLLMIVMGGGGSGSSPMANASILRILRLLRLSRLARMLRSMPELLILIKGMAAASRSVFFTMCLLLLVIYIFAIIMRQLSDGSEAGAKYFESIPAAMYVLLMHGTFLDNLGPVAADIRESGFVLVCIFFMFISMAALMVMNMLIGVLCEVVQAVASTEREEMTVAFVKGKMETILKQIDEDCDMIISKAEFRKILENADAVTALQDVGVDPVGLVDFADYIFSNNQGAEVDEGMSFLKFMELVLELRGSNCATIKDVMNLTSIIRDEAARLEEKLCSPGLEAARLSEIQKVGEIIDGDSNRQGSGNSNAGLGVKVRDASGSKSGSARVNGDDNASPPGVIGGPISSEDAAAIVPPQPLSPTSPLLPPTSPQFPGSVRTSHRAKGPAWESASKGEPWLDQSLSKGGHCDDEVLKLEDHTKNSLLQRRKHSHSSPASPQAPQTSPGGDEAGGRVGGGLPPVHAATPIERRVDKVENFLAAAQDELRKFARQPGETTANGLVATSKHESGNAGGSLGGDTTEAAARLRLWAAKMDEVVNAGLSELRKTRESVPATPNGGPRQPLTKVTKDTSKNSFATLR